MRLTRLYLRNYRVFHDELDLAIPDGLVGIYGVNGSGKSSLVESIRWSLWGEARTSKDLVRTSGVNDPCVTEVEFEHEGHLYLVRRTISGANHTVKAEAHWNNQQVAEGVRDVRTYVHSVLGMDDQAFRASVFAEQKQVAAFSDQRPAQRRDLVLKLLGITPLDRARDTARADAREAKLDHDRLAQRLPDLEQLEEVRVAAEVLVASTATLAAEAEAGAAAAAGALTAAEHRHDEVGDLARTFNDLVVQGKAAAAVVEEGTARLATLAKEHADLDAASAGVDALRAKADGIEALELRRRALDAVAEARRRAEAIAVPDEVATPDEGAVTGARALAEETAAAASSLSGAVRAAEDELARVTEAAELSADLSPEGDCPVCGQALGHALEQVQSHRAAEVKAARARLAAVTKERVAADKAAKAAQQASAAAERDHKAAAKARAAWEAAAARRADADAALAAALTALDPAPAKGEEAKLDKELGVRRAARDELTRIEGRLERLPALLADIAATTSRVEEATATRDALREKVKALAFKPADLDVARQARDDARAAHREAAASAEQARLTAGNGAAALQLATERLDDGRRAHAQIGELAERSRHLGRLGDLLSDFRNNVVATVGPRLAAQAAELFAELTDHEYDQLEVDAETYELQIRDGGRLFGMDRFSGSETDLANLALRVAISEHVRFQSGGAVGLLVLDEVFGPLDEDRKARMLLALERLRSRFRQVLVVTHDSEIKEQLPSAIQVLKLPGRQATARVLTGV